MVSTRHAVSSQNCASDSDYLIVRVILTVGNATWCPRRIRCLYLRISTVHDAVVPLLCYWRWYLDHIIIFFFFFLLLLLLFFLIAALSQENVLAALPLRGHAWQVVVVVIVPSVIVVVGCPTVKLCVY